MDTNKICVVECLDKDEVECCDEDVVAWFDEGGLVCLYNNNKEYFMYILSMHTPWNRFLRKHWVGNVYSTIGIRRKLDDVRSMHTFVITITIKIWWSAMITWIMGGIRSGPIPRPTSPNAFNNFSNIEQGIVVYLFSTTYMSYTFTPSIYSLVGRVAGKVPISNYPITTNSISWKSH